MPDELPSLHIDSDWKKQAQQEKKRLAEEAAKAATPATQSTPVPQRTATAAAAAAPARSGAARGSSREPPPPSFASIVQSMMTQVLFYLGEIATASGQGATDLDMAKHQLDTLVVLEEKTKGNLSEQEQSLLDAALYETRSRFINIASQYLGP